MQAGAVADRECSNEIICRFHADILHPQEGYYRMETADGEFLGNVDEGELGHELSALRERGYWMGHVIRGRGY